MGLAKAGETFMENLSTLHAGPKGSKEGGAALLKIGRECPHPRRREHSP